MDPLEYLFELEHFGIRLGLENITALCEALGNPQDDYQSVIVAGTNGKGSVTAMTEAALRAAGQRAARYTSPHLVRLEERFVVDGQPVATEVLRSVVGDVRDVVERLLADRRLAVHPTFFEVSTAAAFELFRRAGVRIAVLEVGLGGRFDATNAAPAATVAITSIDLDHERHLGATIEEIAFEKAGVIKPGSTVVLGERKPAAVEVFVRACRDRGATLIHAFEGIAWDADMQGGRATLRLRTRRASYPPVPLALAGRHQVANAIVTVRLLEVIADAGLPVPTEAIEFGLSQVVWRGRLDRLALGGGRQLILDAAHNPAGAAALAAHLAETWPERLPIVFGAMRDKDSAGMLRALAPCARRLLLTDAPSPRAAPAFDLDRTAAAVAPDVPRAIEPDPLTAVARALESGPTICVTGSIFLVGAVLAAYEKPMGRAILG